MNKRRLWPLPPSFIWSTAVLLLFIASGAAAWLLGSPAVSAEVKLGWLMALALLFLLVGLGGLGLALRRGRVISLWLALGLANVLPALALLLPGWLPSAGGQAGVGDLAGVWFFWWQAVLLAVLLPSLRANQDARAGQRWGAAAAVLRRKAVVSGLVVGLGLGLASAFLISLQATWFTGGLLPTLSGDNAEPAAWLLGATFFLGLTLAPWAEERFFRQVLVSRWQAPWGKWAAAALFATVQFRPLVWLPAFLLGLALTELLRRFSQDEAEGAGLLAIIVAHAACNAVVYLISPALLF